MAGDDQYDEYQFADLDANPDAMENTTEQGGEPKPFDEEVPPSENKVNVRRNALIAVGCLVLLILIYKVISSIFSTQAPAIKTVAAPTVEVSSSAKDELPSVEAFQQMSAPNTPSSTAQPVTQPASNINAQVETQLSSMSANQQNMQTQVTAINNQLVVVNNNVNAMMEKMVELNRTIARLTTQVDTQYRVIEQITIRMQPKKPKHMPHNTNNLPLTKYYLQAVIPGRAWLIGTNGTTLSVREGTPVNGYGMVKLIDPTQGRVLTSSGKEIRFSQDDS
jgi:intracellular multiplication protein IcmG